MSLALPIDPRDQLDFEPTQPPPVADGVASAFGPLGIAAVRASTVDTESMAFESSWRITEQGGSIQALPAHNLDSSFPTAMATIVHLTQVPFEQIVARKLDPCRWVFAWRIDDRRVAVADANYRVPRSEQTEADSALIRLICDAGIRAGRFNTVEAVNDNSSLPLTDDDAAPAHTAAAAAAQLAALRSGGIPFDQPRADSSLPPQRRREEHEAAPPAADWSYRTLGLAVLCVYAGMAALITLAQRDTTAPQAQASRQQAFADTTMQQRIGGTLALGDYDKLQAELDRFAKLGHFDGAAVTNFRGRAVAIAGQVRDVRVGEPVAREVAASGRTLPLAPANTGAQLLVWDLDNAQPQDVLARTGTLVIGLGVCALATVAALAIALRQRRTGQQPAPSQ